MGVVVLVVVVLTVAVVLVVVVVLEQTGPEPSKPVSKLRHKYVSGSPE